MVALPRAGRAASDTFSADCAKVGLRANKPKESWTPGRDVAVADSPPHVRIAPRGVVLMHGEGGNFEVPITTIVINAPGDQLEATCQECAKLEA